MGADIDWYTAGLNLALARREGGSTTLSEGFIKPSVVLGLALDGVNSHAASFSGFLFAIACRGLGAEPYAVAHASATS